MDIVLRAKHWQIFTGFLFLAIVSSVISNVGPVTDAIVTFVLHSIYFGWLAFLGYGLTKRQGTLQSNSFRIFVASCVLIVASETLLKMLIATGIMEQKQLNIFTFILLFIYIGTLLMIINVYPARTLKGLEARREIDINDYFGDIFLFLFWPIGAWVIQPRINKLIS